MILHTVFSSEGKPLTAYCSQTATRQSCICCQHRHRAVCPRSPTPEHRPTQSPITSSYFFQSLTHTEPPASPATPRHTSPNMGELRQVLCHLRELLTSRCPAPGPPLISLTYLNMDPCAIHSQLDLLLGCVWKRDPYRSHQTLVRRLLHMRDLNLRPKTIWMCATPTTWGLLSQITTKMES